MALIKCPECGGEISDKADHCVHCGCHIIVCPECGQAAIADSEVCTNCGMKLVRTPQTDGQEQPQSENAFQTADNFQKIWESENSGGKMIAKVIYYSGRVMEVIGTILALVGMFSLFSRVANFNSNSDSLDMLLALGEINGLRQKLHLMIICAFTLFALSYLCGLVAECFLPYQYALWFTRKHISAKDVLKNQKGLDAEVISKKDAKSFRRHKTMQRSLFWAENERERTAELVWRAITFLLIVLAFVFSAIALQENLDAYLSSVVITGEFEFQYVNLIIAAVFFVVWIISYFVCFDVFNKKTEKWISSLTEKQS